MLFGFKCRNCGQTLDKVNDRTPSPCSCGGILRRDYSFSFKMPMEDHFNHAVGKYVSSERKLKDEFKAASDAASEQTGTEHRFVPVDPRDRTGLKVTDEGLDTQTKAWESHGLKVGQTYALPK